MTNEEALERWAELPREHTRKAEEKWSDQGYTDQQIQKARKLSIQWYDRHNEMVVDPETGEERRLLGGAQNGAGRPRSKRIGQSIVEWAQDDKRLAKIKTALDRGLSADDERVAVNTVDKIVRIAVKEEELQFRERELDDKPFEELVKMLGPMLAKMQVRGALPNMDELMVGDQPDEAPLEGTVVEDGDRAGRSEQPA